MADEQLILRFEGPKNGSRVETRTPRNRTKPKKYTDFLELSPTKRAKIVYENETSEEDDDTNNETQQKKSAALFDTDDVEGQDIFKFKSCHTKNNLQIKVRNAISNSPVMNTPRRTRMSTKTVEATPKIVKEIIKKRIVQEVESDSDESDFSASTSDFVPNDDSESESSSSASASHNESMENNKTEQVFKKNNKIKAKDTEYVVMPDNYFMMNASKKITTSDHTLARLKNLDINENDENYSYMSEEHKSCMSRLNQLNEQMFDKWLHVLSENFNVIVYGVGSKRNLLQEFQRKKLKDFPCIVVNGYFPSLTIKSILESIVIDLLENHHVPSNTGDLVNLIETQLAECGTELFLIIHNIDGTMLRNSKAQSMLANISQIRNVHTIATIDHINAPLLWDHSKLSKLKWTWWDGTSFAAYAAEGGPGGARRGGAVPLASLRAVHRSLTANAKLIFNILLLHQLDHKQSNYQGLPFKELYSKSREQFLVSSDLALRAQLTEFLDHKLVKIKKSYDASENLVIPIENSLLRQFLEETS